MEEVAPEYDVVVLGTGLTECVISGIMSVKGKKVLHIDRNDHYGSEAASVTLETLFKKYGNSEGEPWKKYGRPNDWNIDLVPKLLMYNAELTNILISTDVTRYLDFRKIGGSYVQQNSDKGNVKIAKLPTNAKEATASPLIGWGDMFSTRSFFQWVANYNENDPKTHDKLNLDQCTMRQVYDEKKLSDQIRDFVGHAMALYTNDDYLDIPGEPKETLRRIRLYVSSMARSEGTSPYIYPAYGLGELPQGFARLSAIYGGTYMLNTIIDEILYEDNKVSGIKATMKGQGDGDEGMKFTTKTKQIFAEPSYFPKKVSQHGHVLKAICVLNTRVPSGDKGKFLPPIAGTTDSFQLIIPQSQVKRKNDIYVAVLSSAHNVCPDKYAIAMVSTIADKATSRAEAEAELKPGLELLKATTLEKFIFDPIPMYEPEDSGHRDQIFVSKSYDATSHFDTTTDDIKDLYMRAAGEPLVVEGLREGVKTS